MCGIAGIYSLSLTKTERNIFHNLLLLNYFRGEDSTGVVRVEQNQVRTTKTLQASPEFLFTDKAEEFISGDGPKDDPYEKPICFIGHCRAATRGSVKLDNAHPFTFENVIGVHNGTLKSSFKYSSEFDTDSEAIYKNIQETDLVTTIKEINKHDSAYVLVYVDSRDNTLNFIKNSQRTLWMTFIYGRTGLVWSSDKEHLKLALKKMGLSNFSGIEPTDTTDTAAFFQLKPHVHMKLELGKPARDFTITDLEIKEKTLPPSVGYSFPDGYGNYSGYYQGQNFSKGKALIKGDDGIYRDPADHAAREARKKKGGASQDYGNFHQQNPGGLQDLSWLNKPRKPQAEKTDKPETILGLGGAPISNKELDYKLKQGCFNCGTVVSFEEYKQGERISQPAAHWYTRDYYCCADCFENSESNWVKYAIQEFNEQTPDSVSVH